MYILMTSLVLCVGAWGGLFLKYRSARFRDRAAQRLRARLFRQGRSR